MSLLSCSRRGCKNIMCNKHSYEHGYICDECLEELINSDVSIHDIADFMDSEKNNNIPLQEKRRIDFNEIFTSEVN